MDVSVIMINYNTFELTQNALDSIFEYTSGLEYEIILIDNNSPDGSGEKLSAHFGDRIKYIQAGANLGTSKSFNLGLRAAGGRYVLWLNTDILIKENFIKKLFDYMESNPRCGICGGNVLDFNGRPAASFRKDFLTIKYFKRLYSIFWNLIEKFPRKRIDYNYTDEPYKVAWIGGVDMFARKSLFDEVGGFDEIIFMYGEELEFQYRVNQLTDYTVNSVPWAHIYHLGGASSSNKVKKFNPEWERLMLKGFPRYLYKWFGRDDVFRYLQIRLRGAKKLRMISRLMRNSVKAERCSGQIELFLSCLNNFDAFIDSIS